MNIVAVLKHRRLKEVAVENVHYLYNAAILDQLDGLSSYRKTLRSFGAEYVKTTINKTNRAVTVSFKFNSLSFFFLFSWKERRPAKLTLTEWRVTPC